MSDQSLRTQLANLLIVRQAHMDFTEAVADFPLGEINSRPPACDYTFWHLTEHIRICQKDILDYIVADIYVWPEFPAGYWPDRTAETDAAGWQRTIDQFLADRQALVDLIHDPKIDLFAPLPHSGEHGHTIVREINIVSSHNAYHTGEVGVLRQVMGLWK